jgi:hypothetical protein
MTSAFADGTAQQPNAVPPNRRNPRLLWILSPRKEEFSDAYASAAGVKGEPLRYSPNRLARSGE